MGEKSARITTSLTVKQCAAVFQAAPANVMSGAAKVQGFVAQIAGGVFTADFFTPQDSGPFAALNDDRPAFSAGTFIRNGMTGTPTEIHMYVWDRRGHREVLLVAAHGLMSGVAHARKIVTSVAEMFKAEDSQAGIALEF